MCKSVDNESIGNNGVLRIEKRLKDYITGDDPELGQSDEIDLIIEQAIFEVIKRVYDKEMMQTEKSMEKAFFKGLTDENKPAEYDSNKQKIKRDLKKIERYRQGEGDKYKILSGESIEAFMSLKKETDDSKSNFESNHYNISNQNTIEIMTFSKLAIYDKILKKQISSVKKVSNEEFVYLYKEYDDHYISRLNRVKSPEITDDEYLSILIDFLSQSQILCKRKIVQ